MGSDSSVTERICRVAAELPPVRDRRASTPIIALMRDLIEQAGYVQHPEALEREAILAVLREHPELIHNWWIWSGDQRWSGTTWCFDKEEDFQRFPKDKARSEPAGEQYRIYQYPKGESLVFHDKTAACAEYILRVIPWSMDRSAKFAKR